MKDYLGYQNKVCLVTGASSGMGKSVCEILVSLGAKVYAVDINDCPVKGIEAFYKCDLSKKQEIDEMFKKLPGHIDHFFGVAGLSGLKTDYITTFNCDFTANKYITLEYLTKRIVKGGSITYVTSTAGKYWQEHVKEQTPVIRAATWEETEKAVEKIAKVAPSTFAYIFAKRCLSQFSAEQALIFSDMNVRVNNVMPGATETGMKDEFENMAGGEKNLIDANGTSGRLATSDEMGMPIVFIGSNMASFISGIDLIIDWTNSTMITLKKKKDPSNVPATNTFILKMAKRMMGKGKNEK